MLHALLSYSSLSADQTMIAIAESDLLDTGHCNNDMRRAAHARRSFAFHRKEWPALAGAESDLAWSSDQATLDNLQNGLLLHVLFGYAAVSDQRWGQGLVQLDALALVTGQP